MAKLITDTGRKAIKKMAQVSQCARALSLMPTAEDFALRLIGDLRTIAKMVNNISTRINEVLDRYSNIPGEFLLEGFDEILKKLNNISDYAKFTIAETTSIMSSTTKSAQEMVKAVGDATSAVTSATLQIGGGVSYGVTAMSANITLAFTGNGRRSMTHDVVQDVVDGKVEIKDMQEEFDKRINNEVGDIDNAANAIKDWTTNSTYYSVRDIDEFFGKGVSGIDDALEWIDGVKSDADEFVDGTVGELIEKVEKAKKDVEDRIEQVRATFNNFVKNFDEHFGFLTGENYSEEFFRNVSNTAYEKMDSPVYDAIGEVSGEIADFIKNFSIGKVVTAMSGLVIGAGTATLVMDLLPSVDVDRMLRDIIGGCDSREIDKLTELYHNKYYEDEPDLLEIPDVTWRLTKDDLEKYNADGYEKYLEKFTEENDSTRSAIYEKMQKAKKWSDISAVTKENKEEMKKNKNKSALKAMRKVRRDAIKAKQIEKYKSFLKIELEYLKRECSSMKINIKNEWDLMMSQYKTAISEIKRFFSNEGSGGNEAIDKCCDRINDDATQIVELCKSITTELVSAVGMVPTPYSVGMAVDMPVHKILAFFKDIKIIITFLKNLIRLGIDIISQLTILAKLIFNGFQSLADIMKLLKDLLGIDTIMSMIEFLIQLFRPKMMDAKILLENAISPIYYNETEEYEEKVNAIEALLEDDKNGGNVDIFRYTDDRYAKDKYRNKVFGGKLKDDAAIEDALEELEAKGEREIVAYRSPILNAEGDDFAGWIFYHADAYDDMKTTWSDRKKRRRNKLIKKASKKNKMIMGRLQGGVAQLKKNMRFGYYKDGRYIANSVNGFDAYYWYTKWTNEPTDCEPDFSVKDNENVVSPIQTTANGSLVELSDGRRVFVEGKNVKSGDFVNVEGVKYRVK
jgi:hypothetical protein